MSKFRTVEYTIPIFSNGVGDSALYGYTDVPKITERCVTISARGTIGYCMLHDEPFYPIIRLISAIPKDMITADYLYYVVQAITIKVPDSGIPQLTVPMLSNYTIPVPPLEVQRHIVSILDTFRTLCTALTFGLPAEIAARQKQYEYYRDKLLTFKELA